MTILKIAAIIICAVMLAVMLKSINSNIHILIVIAMSLIIMIAVVSKMGLVITQINKIASYMGEEKKYIIFLIKIIGITYIAQFTADICRDCGYTTVAGQIEILAKITIAVMSIPLICELFDMTLVQVGAQDMSEEDILGSLLDKDYSKIDKTLNQYDEKIDFQNILKKIINGNFTFEEFISMMLENISNAINETKGVIFEVIVIALFASIINIIIPAFNNKQISDIAALIIHIMLIIVMSRCFYKAILISQNTIEMLIDIYNSVIPIFLESVAFVSKSLSSGIYYECVLLAITLVNVVFKKFTFVMIKGNYLLIMANFIDQENKFKKLIDFINVIIKWTGRITITVFSGTSFVKNLIIPGNASMRRKIFYNTVKIIPGVSDTIGTVSDTIEAAGIVVKNAFGVVGIIVLVIIALRPIIKIFIIGFILKLLAAILEPVSNKSFVGFIDMTGAMIGTMAYIVSISLCLFLIIIAMISVFTGVRN